MITEGPEQVEMTVGGEQKDQGRVTGPRGKNPEHQVGSPSGDGRKAGEDRHYWVRGQGRRRFCAWLRGPGAALLIAAMVGTASGVVFIFNQARVVQTGGGVCPPVVGFTRGPNLGRALADGIVSGVSVSGAIGLCGGSGSLSLGATVNLVAGALNESVIDGFRFYYNSTSGPSAFVTFTVSLSGTSLFPTSGPPFGFLIVNSTTATTSGSYPNPSTDDCLGATQVAAPPNICGSGARSLLSLPLQSNLSGASHATGVSAVTGLVNLSAPTTMICPAGISWTAGASSCSAGAGGRLTAALTPVSGISFVVISLVLADIPPSFSGSSFSITISAMAQW